MVQERELVPFLTNVLTRYGAQVEQASIVCKSLVWSDLVGRVTHGVWRFPTYLKRFRAGLMRCPCNPTIEKTGAGTCRIDGDGGFGHYVGFIAMQNAIEQAREAGCGIAAVCNSNHFGAAGYFAVIAADAGMLGLALSNSVAKVAPYDGALPVFGTNPFAFAVPRRNARPILVDMATAAVSGASMMRSSLNADELKDEMTVLPGTEKAFGTTASAKTADQVLLPFGGAKGAGLALLVEILSGVMSGANLSTGVRSMFNDFTNSGGNGHLFMALDIQRLIDMASYFDRVEQLIDQIKASALSEGGPRLPGDLRWSALDRHSLQGVPLDEETVQQLRVIALEANVVLPTGLGPTSPND